MICKLLGHSWIPQSFVSHDRTMIWRCRECGNLRSNRVDQIASPPDYYRHADRNAIVLGLSIGFVATGYVILVLVFLLGGCFQDPGMPDTEDTGSGSTSGTCFASVDSCGGSATQTSTSSDASTSATTTTSTTSGTSTEGQSQETGDGTGSESGTTGDYHDLPPDIPPDECDASTPCEDIAGAVASCCGGVCFLQCNVNPCPSGWTCIETGPCGPHCEER